MYPIAVGVPVVVFLAGIRIVRPTHKGLVVRLGKYRRFANSGFNWIIPGIERMIPVNTTEQMVEALEKTLSHNAEIIIPSGSAPINIIEEIVGVMPLSEETRGTKTEGVGWRSSGRRPSGELSHRFRGMQTARSLCP